MFTPVIKTGDNSEYDHERWLYEWFYCNDCRKLYCDLPKGYSHCKSCGEGVQDDYFCDCFLEQD